VLLYFASGQSLSWVRSRGKSSQGIKEEGRSKPQKSVARDKAWGSEIYKERQTS